MQLLIQALLVATFVAGTDGQEILFNPLRLITPCAKGLRGDVDNFTFTGTIGRNFTALLASNWDPKVTLEILVSSLNFTKMCDIYIGDGGFFCSRIPSVICYCDHLDATTGAAHFVVNHPAQVDYSAGVIRAVWSNRDGTVVYSKHNTTLPVFYDAKKTGMTLKVNGVLAKQITAPFGVFFQPNKNNIIELCCIYPISPCFAMLAVNGQLYDGKGKCARHTVFVPDLSYVASMALSYSVCTPSGQITVGAGLISTVKEDGAVDEKVPISCPFFFCTLYIAYSLLFLEAMGGIGYLIIWVLFFKKDERGVTDKVGAGKPAQTTNPDTVSQEIGGTTRDIKSGGDSQPANRD